MKRKTLKNNVVTKVVAGLLAVVVFWGSGAVTQAEEEEQYTAQPGSVCMNSETNAWSKSFFIPTQVYQAGGEFYVADAYHQQVLHSSSVASNPESWSIMANGLYRPHATASDGVIYVVVDTDNNRVVTYMKTENGYQMLESIPDVGIRPHYIVYDKVTASFYVWSSMTDTMYVYRRDQKTNQLKLSKAVRIKELDGCYTRSFTIEGGTIFFPCVAKSAIFAVNKKSFKVRAVYPVETALSEMVQVLHIQNYYYLVTSNDSTREKEPKFVRATSLAGFGNGSYEDVKSMFGGMDGNPYYITQGEDGHFYCPVIEGSGEDYICQFDIQNDTICNVLQYFY